ncbi:transketolase, partial [Serratia marcescens]|uniref:transketolase n=1 Tax=Serratia marcescens TaxID=615 RepID=UPI001140B3C4
MSSRKELANAIRALSMDAVQKANSGHPGAPMGMADIAEVLWRDYLNHNPTNPHWADRDRFVLSNGHGSMLIYSLLHLTGYDLPMRELENFRQLHSKTPGHPEYGYTPGVETTTGPLGQGIANAVGFAIAERTLAAQFNRPGHDIVDHHTYAFMGDGCMMEGISHEVCSLAGTLKLGKLTAFYDDNGISIDGHVDGWFTDDTALRFEAYGWHVVRNVDGHNPDAIKAAIEEARQVTDKPSLLMCKTVIGFGSPNKAGTHDVHGAALGAAEVAATREALGWKYAAFEIPQDIYAQWDAKEAGQAKEAAWNDKFAAYARAFPELAAEFKRRMNGELPADWKADAKAFVEKLQANPANIASRKASQNALEAFGKVLPEFLGGSADLAPSNLTLWSGSKALNVDPAGNYIHYGVREFGMTAITNGIALHGGFLPYSAEAAWNDKFAAYARAFPELAAEFKRRMNGELPADWKADARAFVEKLQANPANIASRKASQNALEAFGKVLPEFLGGSADLAPSNLTMWSGSKALNVDPAGNYIHYGVREFGMTAITNGIALHGGFLPYSATFLMFVEYARNAVRMAALMKLRNVFVYTHDSIGLGEDGPTHQPVEQLASLRVTPNMSTWR